MDAEVIDLTIDSEESDDLPIKKPVKREKLINDREGIRSSTNNLPCFLFETLLQPSEAFDLLLNLSPDHPDVASSKPIGVVKPATYVVANTAVGKLDDLKADDVGVWEQKGKPVRSRLPSGEVYGAEVVKESGDNVYDLVRVYYHHKHTPTFLFYIKGKSTQTLKLTKNEENTYYHPMQRCIQMKHPSFNANMLYIPAEIMDNLLPIHKSHIFDHFGIHL